MDKYSRYFPFTTLCSLGYLCLRHQRSADSLKSSSVVFTNVFLEKIQNPRALQKICRCYKIVTRFV